MKRTRALNRTVSLSLVLLAAASLAAPVTARAVSGTQRFTPANGLAQMWTVPAGVVELSVLVVGAGGGSGGLDCGSYGCTRPVASRVGQVQSTLPVTPGDVVAVYPGGAGARGGDNGGCAGLGGAGGASAYGLQGGHGGDAGCRGASGGGGGGGAGSAVVIGGTEVIAGGAAGGAGNRNSAPEWWQWARDDGPRQTGRIGGTGVNPREVRGTDIDGGGGGGGGGGWFGGAGGTEYTCCSEFGAWGGVRGASGWNAPSATETLVANAGDGYVELTWTGFVPSLPSEPRNPVAESTGLDTAHISWQPPADSGDSPVTSYIVEARAPGIFDWRQWETVDATTQSADVAALPCGASVQFRLRATNIAGIGSASTPTDWSSRASELSVCPLWPTVAMPNTTVRVGMVGAKANPDAMSADAVVFTAAGRRSTVPFDGAGTATMMLSPSRRGKTVVTMTSRQLDSNSGVLVPVRASVTVWTPSFTIPTSAMVGQGLRITGTYVQPGVAITVRSGDVAQATIAGPTGSLAVSLGPLPRGTQPVQIWAGTVLLTQTMVKVGGKQSTW